MSVQVHCDNCDESLGRATFDMLGRGFAPADSGVLETLVKMPGDQLRQNYPDYFCDWLCLAKWAKRKASDE